MHFDAQHLHTCQLPWIVRDSPGEASVEIVRQKSDIFGSVPVLKKIGVFYLFHPYVHWHQGVVTCFMTPKLNVYQHTIYMTCAWCMTNKSGMSSVHAAVSRNMYTVHMDSSVESTGMYYTCKR